MKHKVTEVESYWETNNNTKSTKKERKIKIIKYKVREIKHHWEKNKNTKKERKKERKKDNQGIKFILKGNRYRKKNM